MKLIYIEWIDSTAPGTAGWHSDSEVEGFADGDFLIFDVGFVYKETKDYLVLVGGMSREEEDFEQLFHREIKVPKCAVTKRIDLTKHLKANNRPSK